MCDSDSELVKITRSKSKSKSRSTRFRKKPKDKTSKEHVAEKGDEDLTASATRGPVLSSSDNLAVGTRGDVDIGKADKEEGTSSDPQVCVGRWRFA